ncbi:hypothetical protein [Paraburkholderia sp.]|jgi:hypothetical protein|uniref:hypothetical protein n=1 Tax=Paraburkholderia sp. TaxID=1926495 RepID=UPI002F3FCEA0
MTEMDTYGLAVGSPLSLPTFFAAAKKVGAAPHRGEANRPLRIQGEANAAGKQPNSEANKPLRMQGKANAVGKQPKHNAIRPKANQRQSQKQNKKSRLQGKNLKPSPQEPGPPP